MRLNWDAVATRYEHLLNPAELTGMRCQSASAKPRHRRHIRGQDQLGRRRSGGLSGVLGLQELGQDCGMVAGADAEAGTASGDHEVSSSWSPRRKTAPARSSRALWANLPTPRRPPP